MRTDYERLAARYDEDRARWSVPADDVVTALLGSWTAARPVRVVDLGCGTGRWILPQRDALGAERVTWLGVDPSAAMLTEARRKGIAGLVRGRAEDLPLANASVDYVVSSFVFHHIVDKERAIDELDRVLVADRAVVRISNIEPAAARGWWVYEHFPEAVAVDAARFWPA